MTAELSRRHCRKRVSVRMACDEVIQMKNKKITVPCDSKQGNMQHAVRDEQDQQGNQERRHESGQPGETGEAFLLV